MTQNVTVDGAVEMLDDWFDPADQDPEVLAEMRRQDATSDAILLGRQTFEDFRGYWRHRDDDPTGIGAQLDGLAKHVVSTTLTDPAWENTTVIQDGLDGVRRLLATPGQDVVVTGSISLCHAVDAAGLVDEYRLFVYPVVQGRGRRLFPEGSAPRRLRALETRQFADGVALVRYAS
ncbi:dihydrofolate reductase family protein [Luteimicrobium subarcticum]|uniref:dihydrofolate reductase family protein n=1 Tax=Luteimicrobium subarcticum TaxID=620910 RepID=UPI001FE9EF28|nr:dihydrofolate reductase family protein [Luteimicrobium subarcticum]